MNPSTSLADNKVICRREKIMQYVKKVFFRAVTIWIRDGFGWHHYDAPYKNIDQLFEDICDRFCSLIEDPQFIERCKRYEGFIEEWYYYFQTDPNFDRIPEVIELDSQIELYKEMVWKEVDQIFQKRIPGYSLGRCQLEDDLDIMDLFLDILQ